MKGLVFDSSFPLVFFLINLVSFQSFLGSWLHFYNGPSKSKICGISAGVCSAAAEGGPEGLSRNATGRVGTCWNSLCPEGSWRIIIHHYSLCFILFHIMMPLDASTEFDYRVSFFLESDISLCICVALLILPCIADLCFCHWSSLPGRQRVELLQLLHFSECWLPGAAAGAGQSSFKVTARFDLFKHRLCCCISVRS